MNDVALLVVFILGSVASVAFSFTILLYMSRQIYRLFVLILRLIYLDKHDEKVLDEVRKELAKKSKDKE